MAIKNFIVVGLGKTGLSCLDFLTKQNRSVTLVDTRNVPPNQDNLKQLFPKVPAYFGALPDLQSLQPYEVVLSPGVSVKDPFLQPLLGQASAIKSDITLFADHMNLPIIGITGSNGKSTVTTLMGEIVRACGLRPAVIGNIGVPVLSIMDEIKNYDIVVMELSSFQLEISPHLKTKAAVVLNLSPDHLDRYASLEDYAQAKHLIYQNTSYAVVNLTEPLATPSRLPANIQYFTDQKPADGVFGLEVTGHETHLAFGKQRLVSVRELKLMGAHNVMNVLAALSLGHVIGLPMKAMIEAVKEFQGLPHRCEYVDQFNGVQWINDSKGTNVGASLAALEGLEKQLPANGKIILILGGQGKGQDFSPLKAPIRKSCRAVIVMGENQHALAALLKEDADIFHAQDMQQVVSLAQQHARVHDIVLLSPACASFDQYQHFEHRGDCFKQAVRQLIKAA